MMVRTQKGKLLIIVGAGISLDAPTLAPSPFRVIKAALSPMLSIPAIHELVSKDERISKILEWPLKQMLPESFYAAIESSFDSTLHQEVWSPLSRTGLLDKTFNVNHEIIALLAQRLQATIITPNYDSFLEAALEGWGIPYRVIHNYEIARQGNFPQSGVVTVIKIHGDATKPETIVTRAPDLLRLFQALSPLNNKFSAALVAGYSGRDLDIYPWLASKSGVQNIAWVDPYMNDDHRCYRLPIGDGLIVLREKLEVLQKLVLDDSQNSRVRYRLNPVNPGKDCENIAHIRIKELVESEHPARTNLALAKILTNSGFHASSYEILKIARCDSDLLLHSTIRMVGAFNLSCMDRFGTAYHVCDDIIKSGHPILKFQARALRASCKRQYYLQTAQQGEVHKPPFPRYGNYRSRGILEKLLREIQFLGSVIRLTPYGLRSVQSASLAIWNTLHPSFEDACAYLETLIRFYATFQYIGTRYINAHALKAIDYWSHRIGYINGAIHVEKYATRLDLVDIAETGGTFGRLNVMEELISSAIMKRDEILNLSRRRNSENLDNELSALLYDAGEAAWLSGSSSLSQAILREYESIALPSESQSGHPYWKLKSQKQCPQLYDTTGLSLAELRKRPEML